MTSNRNDRTTASERAAETRTRIGNTPTCEDCGKPLEECDCDELEPRITTESELLRENAKRVGFTN